MAHVLLTIEEEILLGFEKCAPDVQAKVRVEAQQAKMPLFDYLVLELEKTYGCDQTQA
jgi:hypothetical protein